MPEFGTILFLLNVGFIIHAVRTGRFWPWAYVMFFLPGFGVAAYVFFELLPEWRGAPRVRKARGRLAKAIDPQKSYRALREAIETADTIGNRLALAQECLALGKNEEARGLFDDIIRSPQGDEPVYYLGRARAEFGLDQAGQALATLDDLKRQWPDYRSQEGHLLYARALEKLGRPEEALAEYTNLARYYAGPEPRIRQMWLLDAMGRRDDAMAIARDVSAGLKRAPDFARKRQAEWYAAAKTYLKG